MSFFSGFFASSTPSAAPPVPRGHQKKLSIHAPTATRQNRVEDEQVYGAPSPGLPSTNGFYSTDDASTSFANISLSDASYPPPPPQETVPAPRTFKPYFSESLQSPLGMGRGDPIPTSLGNALGCPPLRHTWSRIRTALASVPELPESLASPATPALVSHLDRVLSSKDDQYRLPRSVRDHFLCHDGQDPFAAHSASMFGGGQNGGLVFGLWVMSLEDVEAEWGFWRRLDDGTMPGDAFSATDFRSLSSRNRIRRPRKGEPVPIAEEDEEAEGDEKGKGVANGPNTPTRGKWIGPEMGSCPAGWVREVYSHPGWVPLLSDRAGNYIGIDLDPPPSSTRPTSAASGASLGVGGGQGASRPAPGQVIAFGREMDEKVVLWRGDGEHGWGKWLASVAEDLEEGGFAVIDGIRRQDGLQRRRRRATRPGSEGGGTAWFNNGTSAVEDDSDDEDEEDKEDGLGEVGYFNDGSASGYGEHGERRVAKGWRLKGPYRGMGVIEALCERSRRRWAEVGLHRRWRAPSPRPANYVSPAASPRSPKLDSSELDPTPDLVRQTTSPPPSAGLEASETDPLTIKPVPAPAEPSSQPGTPVAFVTPPSPARRPVSLPSRGPQDLRRLSGDSAAAIKAKRLPSGGDVRRRSANNQRPRPPPPAGLGLPTMEDLMKEARIGQTDLDADDAWTPPSTIGPGSAARGRRPLTINGNGAAYQDLSTAGRDPGGGQDSPTSPRLTGSSFTRIPLVGAVGRLSSDGGKRQSSLEVLPTVRTRPDAGGVGKGEGGATAIEVVSTREGASEDEQDRFVSPLGSPSFGTVGPMTPPKVARSGSLSPRIGGDGGWSSPGLGIVGIPEEGP